MHHKVLDVLIYNKHRLDAGINIKSDYEGAHSFVCWKNKGDTQMWTYPRTYDKHRFDAGIDIKLDYEGAHSFVCCPLLTGSGECMGVIQLVKFGVGQVVCVFVSVCLCLCLFLCVCVFV